MFADFPVLRNQAPCLPQFLKATSALPKVMPLAAMGLTMSHLSYMLTSRKDRFPFNIPFNLTSLNRSTTFHHLPRSPSQRSKIRSYSILPDFENDVVDCTHSGKPSPWPTRFNHFTPFQAPIKCFTSNIFQHTSHLQHQTLSFEVSDSGPGAMKHFSKLRMFHIQEGVMPRIFPPAAAAWNPTSPTAFR